MNFADLKLSECWERVSIPCDSELSALLALLDFLHKLAYSALPPRPCLLGLFYGSFGFGAEFPFALRREVRRALPPRPDKDPYVTLLH